VTAEAFDPERDYPLGTRRPDLVATPGGTPLAEVTLDGLRAGRVDAADLRATPETLLRQAAVAHAAGRAPLADNLARAAELALVPDDEILEIYTALRPHRSTEDDLLRWATRLEEAYGAHQTAAFVRGAIPVYSRRKLLLEPDRGRERASL
jgi:propanediol dehydratase small subunit